jgi:hypothetical protein
MTARAFALSGSAARLRAELALAWELLCWMFNPGPMVQICAACGDPLPREAELVGHDCPARGPL